MGRMHPTPSPTWESYIFPDTVEPSDRSTMVKRSDVMDLSEHLNAAGELHCTLPQGDWTILYFGMITTGKRNKPAPPSATGLECDKMSKQHVRHHFDSMFGELLEKMTPAERAAFKGITIDSYEVGSQNWTDGFAAEFEKRNGYNPIRLLPVMTGRVIDSAKTSDQFLWDLRRTVADMIAKNYVGGLRDAAHEHDLKLWCENYGHWGFPGEFLIYGGYTDMIGGEFWTTNLGLGGIECRAASSSGHIYGKRRIFAEAFTSALRLQHTPYTFKARGEELFCEGINHFVLHVYAHQARDGVPGKNPWFGTAFHRNTPWFNEAQSWVKYLQRCHTMLQQGNPVADVAVYIGDFAPQMTGPANPVPAGYDYDYMGSDAILRTLDVVDGKWVVFDEKDPKRIAASYSLLAMPKVKTIRPAVLKRLDELKAKGGKVVNGVPVTAQTLLSAGIDPIVSETSCPIRWKARELDDGKIFFLSNFKKTGTFEATLRVTGKAPEWFNPVTGKITRLARYQRVNNGTRIVIDIKDKSDSCFIVFRDQVAVPSVAGVQQGGKEIAPDELDLFYDADNKLTAESTRAGEYTLSMSDGTKRMLVIEQSSNTFAITTPWQEQKQDAQGYSVLKETTFDLPSAFGKGQRVVLDLGHVEVMAKVTLNGKTFDTLWMPPFTLDVTDVVKPGKNTLKVLVTSTSKGQPKLGKAVQLKTAIRRRSATAQPYCDGRPAATLRMDAKDHGIVLRYGDGPDQCDELGARDVWVYENNGTYYMHYDAAGPTGWLCSLATSKDLLNWEKKGPVLDLGQPGEGDSKGACYGVTYQDGDQWHMFYLGTPNVSPAPNLIPSFPYLTMKAKGKSPAGPWVKQKSVVPFSPKPGTYYSATASPGQVIKQGDEYLQFFSASTHQGGIKRTLGIARTKNLDGPWTVDPKPILPLEEQIENSTFYYEKSNQTWFLFTNHIGIDRGEYTDAIWVYWSKDLNQWDPVNKAVVLDGQNCSWSKKCIGLPSVIQVGKRLAIFYDAPEGSSTSHMKRHVGLAWLELPLSAPSQFVSASEPSSISHGPMLGAVSEQAARIWVRTTDPADVTCALFENGATSEQLTQKVRTTLASDHTCIIQFDGLKKETEYQYVVRVGKSERAGTFTTLGPSLSKKAIRVVYGYGYNHGENKMKPGTSVFTEMASRNADLVLFLGDFPYTARGGREEVRKGSQKLREVTGFAQLTDSTPTYGIYDDHDFGPNDCDGTHPNADEALAAFKEYWPNPSYGLPEDKGIYYSFVVGDIEFFLLDGRYPARKAQNTMLGKVQFKWLCDGLKNSKSRYKVLVSGTQFGRVKGDSWAGQFYLDERQKLFSFIAENDISGVIGISGDVHRSDIYKLPIGNDRYFYDFTPGALSREHRTPPDPLPETMIHSYGDKTDSNMYGEIEFRPASDQNTAIIFRSLSAKNGLVYEHTLTPNDLTLKK